MRLNDYPTVKILTIPLSIEIIPCAVQSTEYLKRLEPISYLLHSGILLLDLPEITQTPACYDTISEFEFVSSNGLENITWISGNRETG